ncbi:MAG: hypothetical protein U0174_20455 [Polyangiaceae bacterium]
MTRASFCVWRARFLVFAGSILLALSLLGVPRTAHAQETIAPQGLPARPAAFSWEKTLLRATFSYRDLVDKAAIDKLSSGLPTVLATRVYVFREGDKTPVALAVRSCRVVYDLWDEVYRIRVSTSGPDRDVASLNLEGVLRQCAEAKDFALAEKAVLPAGATYFLGVIAEVNPIAPEMAEQMRRWVSRPAGATGISPGDALFGSFVSLFVQKLGSAERTLRFRSQAFTL